MKKFITLWKQNSYILLFIFLPLVALVDYRFGLVALLCIILPIIFSFFTGKFWCGNLCPRGSFFDNVIYKFSNNKKTPKIFQSIIFRISVVIGTIIYFIYELGKMEFSLESFGFLLCKFMLMTTLISIALATFYNERTWCQFCPVGNISSLNSKLFNRFNKKRLLKVGSQCSSCQICETTCPMNISVSNYKGQSITDINCISCEKCIAICPNNEISK